MGRLGCLVDKRRAVKSFICNPQQKLCTPSHPLPVPLRWPQICITQAITMNSLLAGCPDSEHFRRLAIFLHCPTQTQHAAATIMSNMPPPRFHPARIASAIIAGLGVGMLLAAAWITASFLPHRSTDNDFALGYVPGHILRNGEDPYVADLNAYNQQLGTPFAARMGQATNPPLLMAAVRTIGASDGPQRVLDLGGAAGGKPGWDLLCRLVAAALPAKQSVVDFCG